MSLVTVDVSTLSSAVGRSQTFCEVFGHVLRREFLYSRPVLEDWTARIQLLEGVLMSLQTLVRNFHTEPGLANLNRRSVQLSTRLASSATDCISQAFCATANSDMASRVRGTMGSELNHVSGPSGWGGPGRGPLHSFSATSWGDSDPQEALLATNTALTNLNQLGMVLKGWKDDLLRTAKVDLSDKDFCEPEDWPMALPPGWGPSTVFDLARRELYFSLRSPRLLDVYLKARHLFLAHEYQVALSPPAWNREIWPSVLGLLAEALRRFEGGDDRIIEGYRQSLAWQLQWLRCRDVPSSCDTAGKSDALDGSTAENVRDAGEREVLIAGQRLASY